MAEMVVIGVCLMTALFLWAMVIASKQADRKLREMMMGREVDNGIHEGA